MDTPKASQGQTDTIDISSPRDNNSESAKEKRARTSSQREVVEEPMLQKKSRKILPKSEPSVTAHIPLATTVSR